jgi:outer membrane receptor protein involved in Fe transport
MQDAGFKLLPVVLAASLFPAIVLAQDAPAAEATAEAPVEAPEAADPLATVPVDTAADASAAPADGGSPEGGRKIEEIIVTATKREESLREIPQSIAAFSGADLEQQGKLNLDDYVKQTPGVVTNQTSPGLIRLTVRGISTNTSPTSPIPSPVGILIGDTAFSDPYIAGVIPDLSAFDLSGVQVLKGPQGTLFGGAALSGAIRYVLQDPVLDEWQARAFSQYVNAHEGESAFTSGAAVNLPWTDHGVALRLGYVKRKYPGIIDDDRNDEKDVNDGGGEQYRASLLWQPLDALKLKLTHLQQDFDAKDQKTISDDRDTRATDQLILPQPGNNKFKLDSLEASYDFESMRLVSLTSYNEKNLYVFADATPAVAGTPPQNYPLVGTAVEWFNDNSHAVAQEIRMQSTGDDAFRWLVGGYWYKYTLGFDIFIDTFANQLLSGEDSVLNTLLGGNLVNLNKETSLLYASTHAKSQEKALFFDLTQTLWGDLEVSAGARLYKTYVDGGFVGQGIISRAAGGGTNVDYRSRIDEKGISPKFSITWHATDDIQLYGAATRGFRFGGLQSAPSTPTNGVPPTYKSDTLWSYELGTRTNWLEDSLHADLTFFYIDYKNPQIVQQSPDLHINYTDNVSAAISKGVEASLLWRPPVPGMTLAFNAGKTDAHITKQFTASDGTIVQPGSQLPGAAKWQYSGQVRQFFMLGPVALDANVEYVYVGEGYGDITHTQAINDFGVVNAGLSIGSEAIPLHPRLSFNVANITNETAAVAGTTAGSLAGPTITYFTLNPPRMVSLRLSLEF